jgi:hypothetical protein
MFRFKWTQAALAEYERLKSAGEACLEKRRQTGETKSSKPEGLFGQVRKALQMLAANPRHTGLNTHEFRSLEHPFDKDGKVFEAHAQNQTPGAYRIFWCHGPAREEITILAIAPHP